MKNGNKKFGTLHEFACHPCAGAMLIFSVSFQFYRMRRLLHRSRTKNHNQKQTSKEGRAKTFPRRDLNPGRDLNPDYKAQNLGC